MCILRSICWVYRRDKIVGRYVIGNLRIVAIKVCIMVGFHNVADGQVYPYLVRGWESIIRTHSVESERELLILTHASSGERARPFFSLSLYIYTYIDIDRYKWGVLEYNSFSQLQINGIRLWWSSSSLWDVIWDGMCMCIEDQNRTL